MTDHTVEHVEFEDSQSGILLRGRFVIPASYADSVPLVIYLTGDGPKGTKSLSWTNLPPMLLDRGVASFLFDFEGLGNSEGDRSHLTVSRAVSNLHSAYRVACANHLVNTRRIGIFASSFGATALLLRPDIANSVKLLGFKSPAGSLADAYANEAGESGLDVWLAQGYSRELGYDIEVLADAIRCDAYLTATRILTPTYITHGDSDTIVPVRQSKYLKLCLGGPTRLDIFPGVNHGYSEPGAWDRMARIFVDWFAAGL